MCCFWTFCHASAIQESHSLSPSPRNTCHAHHSTRSCTGNRHSYTGRHGHHHADCRCQCRKMQQKAHDNVARSRHQTMRSSSPPKSKNKKHQVAAARSNAAHHFNFIIYRQVNYNIFGIVMTGKIQVPTKFSIFAKCCSALWDTLKFTLSWLWHVFVESPVSRQRHLSIQLCNHTSCIF